MATPIHLRRLLAGALALLLFAGAASVAAEFEGFDSADESEDLSGEDFVLASSSSSPSPAISQSAPVAPREVSSPAPPVPPKPASSNLSPGFEVWDEDEFEGLPSADPPPPAPVVEEEVAPEELKESSSVPDVPPSPSDLATTVIRKFYIEILCVLFLICFAVNYFVGKKQNENIALTWATCFATKDTIFDKNFSLLGTGDGKDTPLLLKEGQDVFKFYASGRRFCQGLLATMELKSRHDLIARIVGLVFQRKDAISFEVVMNDDGMDHVVMAMARKKLAKTMLKEEKDLIKFAGVVGAPGVGVTRRWVSDELTVVAESKEVAGDLIPDAVLDQVFGEKAFQKFGKWFISLHFSDQQQGSYKKALMFKFVLPDVHNMAEMSRLVALVPYYIDLVGRYKLSSHARTKTETARSKAAQEAYKEMQGARQEALQKKKAEKRKQQEEAEAKLSAEALRKKEEKERARQLKKSMPKVKMLR